MPQYSCISPPVVWTKGRATRYPTVDIGPMLFSRVGHAEVKGASSGDTVVGDTTVGLEGIPVLGRRPQILECSDQGCN